MIKYICIKECLITTVRNSEIIEIIIKVGETVDKAVLITAVFRLNTDDQLYVMGDEFGEYFTSLAEYRNKKIEEIIS